MKKQNKQKGITLIALVITIIVLLILAGITINLTIGQDGIITKAQQAGKNYVDAANYENQMLKDFESMTDEILTNVTGQNRGTSTPTGQNLADVAQPGDYVEYDGGNGYTGIWRVLYNDSTYGLQIISDTSVGNYTLGGGTENEAKTSYNNAVDTLNSECAKYVNISYAISGRCVGSDPLSPADAIADTDTVTLPFQYNGSTDSGCKVADTNYETDFNAMKAATNQGSAIYNITLDYWLASRHCGGSSGIEWFGVRYVDTSGYATGNSFVSVVSDGRSYPGSFSLGVRPVVTLKNEIQTNSGDGSSGSPFKLVAK